MLYSTGVQLYLLLFVASLQCRCRDQEVKECRDRLSEVEKDLQVAEQEKENMHKKVELLEKALESPGSRITLRRILERCANIWVVELLKDS